MRSQLKKLLEALLSRYADIPCLQILGDSDEKGVLAVFELGFDYFKKGFLFEFEDLLQMLALDRFLAGLLGLEEALGVDYNGGSVGPRRSGEEVLSGECLFHAR